MSIECASRKLPWKKMRASQKSNSSSGPNKKDKEGQTEAGQINDTLLKVNFVFPSPSAGRGKQAAL